MKLVATCSLILLLLTACTPQQRNPDRIREDTAKATAEAKRDAHAVVQGVEQGLRENGPVNINKAPADDLKSLPGIDDATARRIVDGRPYNDSYDMVRKHIVSRAEYDQIAGKVTAR